MGVLIFFWFLNFAISWFNAWVVGRTWNESKHVGGLPHFLNWCGGIMSASGFTWCYLVIIGLLGTVLPESLLMDSEEVKAVTEAGGVIGPIIAEQTMQAFLNLGYIMIYFPIVGTGIAITINAWAHFYRERSFGSGAVAAYDTMAMIYNISSGVRHLPGAFDGVGSFFGDNDSKEVLLVLFLVAMSIGTGILTTVLIAKSSANAVRRDVIVQLRTAAAANM